MPVIILHADGSFRADDRPASTALNGWLELCARPDLLLETPTVAFCDEDGVRKGLPHNKWQPRVRGPIVIASSRDDESFEPGVLEDLFARLAAVVW